MTLAEELARKVCSHEKRADALTGARDEFENSALSEQAMRDHAQRLEELAASRASQEDTSPGGYAATAAKRLMPVPHTAGEAAVRLPAMVAGGVAGHRFGKSFEPMSASGLEQVFNPTNKALEAAIPHQFRTINPTAQVATLIDELGVTPGHQISDALRERAFPGMSRPGADLRKKFVDLAGGESNMPKLRSAIGRHIAPEKDVVSRMSRYGLGGAVGGALGAGAIAGLPFVIRALLQKRHGGEAAVRARGQAAEATQKAEGESQHREDILNKLPAEKTAGSLGLERTQRLMAALAKKHPPGTNMPFPSAVQGLSDQAQKGVQRSITRTALVNNPWKQEKMSLQPFELLSKAMPDQSITFKGRDAARSMQVLNREIRHGERNPAKLIVEALMRGRAK